MQRNDKVCSIHGKQWEEQSREAMPEEAQKLNLVDNGFKTAIITCSKN